MLYRVIDETEMPALVAAFMERYEVVAPVKRGNKYVFSAVDSFDDIALDYPTTIASPKKYLLPGQRDPLRVRCRAKRGDRLRR